MSATGQAVGVLEGGPGLDLSSVLTLSSSEAGNLLDLQCLHLQKRKCQPLPWREAFSEMWHMERLCRCLSALFSQKRSPHLQTTRPWDIAFCGSHRCGHLSPSEAHVCVHVHVHHTDTQTLVGIVLTGVPNCKQQKTTVDNLSRKKIIDAWQCGSVD